MPIQIRRFAAPPVDEVVLGVQFDALPAWSAAHAGWFWKESLAPSWERVQEALRLDDAFERFGEREFKAPGGITLREPNERPRVQLVSANDDRLIQIQDTRLHYNWRKRTSPYPGYDGVKSEFVASFGAFERFVSKAGLGELSPNQWELTYVDLIYQGDLWRSPDDWPRILQILHDPAANIPNQRLDTISLSYSVRLHEDRGRLHLKVNHAKRLPSGPEAIRLEFTARGPAESQADVMSGLDLGHESVTQMFRSMISEEAQQSWEPLEPK